MSPRPARRVWTIQHVLAVGIAIAVGIIVYRYTGDSDLFLAVGAGMGMGVFTWIASWLHLNRSRG